MKRVSKSAAAFFAATLIAAASTPLFGQVLDVPVARVELYKVDIVTQSSTQSIFLTPYWRIPHDVPPAPKPTMFTPPFFTYGWFL